MIERVETTKSHDEARVETDTQRDKETRINHAMNTAGLLKKELLSACMVTTWYISFSPVSLVVKSLTCRIT